MISLDEVQQIVAMLRDSTGAGMGPADAAAVLISWPRMLACEPAQLCGTMRFLREELAMGTTAAAAVVKARPRVLGMNLADLQHRVAVLQASTGLSDSELRVAVVNEPKLLAFLPETMWRSAAELATHFGGQEALRKMVAKQPRVLMAPVTTRQAALDWCAAAGLTAEQTAKAVAAHPELLTVNATTLQRRFNWLMDSCSLDRQQAASLLYRCPTLLLRDMGNVTNSRKLLFLVEVIRRPLSQVGQFPSYFHRSLKDVIAPRTYLMRALEIPISPTLHYLRYTKADFCKRCNLTEAEYTEWLAAWRQTPEGRRWGS